MALTELGGVPPTLIGWSADIISAAAVANVAVGCQKLHIAAK